MVSCAARDSIIMLPLLERASHRGEPPSVVTCSLPPGSDSETGSRAPSPLQVLLSSIDRAETEPLLSARVRAPGACASALCWDLGEAPGPVPRLLGEGLVAVPAPVIRQCCRCCVRGISRPAPAPGLGLLLPLLQVLPASVVAAARCVATRWSARSIKTFTACAAAAPSTSVVCS